MHEPTNAARPASTPMTSAEAPRKRRPRIYHDPALARPYPLELIQRWDEALLALDQFRFLTNGQAAELLFIDRSGPDGRMRSERAARAVCNEKCLLRLKDAELIERIPVYRTHPLTRSVYLAGVNLLTTAGAKLVRELRGGEPIRWHRRLREWAHRSVDHELAINDLGIALLRACERHGWLLDVWLDDDQVARLRDAVTLPDLIPDAFALVEGPCALNPLFVEVDRGTETVRARRHPASDWRGKIERYTRYLNDPALTRPFWRKLGLDGQQLAAPVVLTVTTGPARREHLRAATSGLLGERTFWYAARDEVFAKRDAVLGPVWWVAGESTPHSLGAWLDPPAWSSPPESSGFVAEG